MRKHPYHLHIYIPPEKEKIVKDFIELFKARNESASQKLVSFMELELERNQPNPQRRLHIQYEPPKCQCGKKSVYRVIWANGGIGFLCEHHFQMKRAKHQIKGWRPQK